MRTRRMRLIAAHNGIRARLGADPLHDKINPPPRVRQTPWTKLMATVERLREDVDAGNQWTSVTDRLRQP
jgi:hypothetical protein